MSKKRRSLRAIFAIVLTIVMMLSFAVPALAEVTPVPASQLLPPVVTSNLGSQRQYTLAYVTDAVSYTIFAFDTLDAAQTGNISQAVAWTTIPYFSTATYTVSMRFQTFLGPATRPLPAGYTPAGLGTTNAGGLPGYGAYTTNLIPGVYWLRAMANAAIPANNSPLSVLNPVAGQGLVIAMGPDEARALIQSRFADIGTTLQILDLRPLSEAGDEGVLRFTTATTLTAAGLGSQNGLLAGAAGETVADELLLTGGLTRAQVTVLVY